MPLLGQFTGPEVRTVTRFDTDQARFQFREELQHICSAELPLYDRSATAIDAINLEYVFRNIETDGERRH